MEISGLTQAGTKLLDALEKMGTSPGAELHSPSGPSGLPSTELVQTFEAALNEPNAVNAAENLGSPSVPVADLPQDTLHVNAPESFSLPDRVDGAGTTQNAMSSLQAVTESLGNVISGTLSPEELFKLQYHASMIKLQGSSGKSLSQEASQGLESLLKQQG